jgi:hypothetical protein
MFSYIRKINKLYNGDHGDGSENHEADGDHDADGDNGVYLFDSQTIANWATEANWATPQDESGDIPSIFSYN